jgi:NAD(P)H-hydrate epimerase
MYHIENVAVQNGFSIDVLMENAGKGCAEWIQSRFNHEQFNHVLVVCGQGNNGGDGFVISRYLNSYGFSVQIALLGDTDKMTAIAKQNFQKCQHIDTVYFADFISLDQITQKLTRYDIIIDAVFGIGFAGVLPHHLVAFSSLKENKYSVLIAIDVPSGLDANTGIMGRNYIAKFDYTLALGFPKIGLYLNDAPDFVGKIEIIDIGIPHNAHFFEQVEHINKKNDKYDLVQLTELMLESDITFPNRLKSSHKGNFGRVSIVAGSTSLTGAAILSCQAALVSGAGLITLYHQPGLETIFEATLLEVITRPLDPNDDETIRQIVNSDAILVGPGLGQSEWATMTVETIVDSIVVGPIIFDADALNILAKNKKLLEKLADKKYVYLTPHVMEFSRLSGKTVDEINLNPIVAINEFVGKYQIHTLLKSHYCLFRNKNKVYIPFIVSDTIMITDGNDGLSKGGSGDVLSGMIISLLAQYVGDYQRAGCHPSLIDIDFGYEFCSAVKYFYMIAKKLSKTYKTPAITPSRIVEHIFKIDD